MTRKEYIDYYNSNKAEDILYEFYKEKFDDKKHSPLLDKQHLIHFLMVFGQIDYALNVAYNYFNNKFNILIVNYGEKSILV